MWISGRDSQTVVSGDCFLKNNDAIHFGPLPFLPQAAKKFSCMCY